MSKFAEYTEKLPESGLTDREGTTEQEFYARIHALLVRAPMGSYKKGLLQCACSTFNAMTTCHVPWENVKFAMTTISIYVR